MMEKTIKELAKENFDDAFHKIETYKDFVEQIYTWKVLADASDMYAFRVSQKDSNFEYADSKLEYYVSTKYSLAATKTLDLLVEKYSRYWEQLCKDSGVKSTDDLTNAQAYDFYEDLYKKTVDLDWDGYEDWEDSSMLVEYTLTPDAPDYYAIFEDEEEE